MSRRRSMLRPVGIAAGLVLVAVPCCTSNLDLGVENNELGPSQTSEDTQLPGLGAFDGAPVAPADPTDDTGGGGNEPVDQCPDNPDKDVRGICGCDELDVDSDGDGALDCNDPCPQDENKIDPGDCGCGEPEGDADGDGVPDCKDACPNDEALSDLEEGYSCGCGQLANDGDGDGVPDCADDCPDDPDKSAPGLCECGVPDDDTDADGRVDCLDSCPEDPAKDDPGECGCGELDVDSDQDGRLDCDEACPLDPLKTAPGVCGCGMPDVDSDGNGSFDCQVGRIVLSDDFETGNGAQWTLGLGQGVWGVVADGVEPGNQVFRQTDVLVSRTVAFAGDSTWTDVALEASVRIEEGDNAEVYLATRYRDSNNFYYMYMRRNGKFRARKFIGGSTTELGADAIDIGELIETGIWYTLRFEVFGPTLSMYFEGNFVGSIDDIDFAAGSIGIGVQDGVVSFDDISVTLL